jgi:hypothetical protein
VAVGRLTLARQCNTCFKNIYCVGTILLHSLTIGIFEEMFGDAQCLTSYQFAYSTLHNQLAFNLAVTVQMKNVN